MVVEQQHCDQSYMVKTPTGTHRRNRAHLNKIASNEGSAQQCTRNPLQVEQNVDFMSS